MNEPKKESTGGEMAELEIDRGLDEAIESGANPFDPEPDISDDYESGESYGFD